MVSIALSAAIAVLVHLLRYVGDRGSREVLVWCWLYEDFIERVSAHDRGPLIVRDQTGRVMRSRARTRFAVQIIGTGVVLVASLVFSHDSGPGRAAVGSFWALLFGFGFLGEAAAYRRMGTTAYRLPRRSWTIIVLTSLTAAASMWFAIKQFHRAAYDVQVGTTDWLEAWMLVTAALGIGFLACKLGIRIALRTSGGPDFGTNTAQESFLLLRSFSDDNLKIYAPNSSFLLERFIGSRLTFEEHVASILRSEGPLVAIGRPGERLPRLGAARTYVPDGDWQYAVQTTAARTGAIFLIAGTSAGLAWEVGHLRDWGLLPKTMILLPPASIDESSERLGCVLRDLGLDDEATTDALQDFAVTTVLGVRRSFDGELLVHTCNGRDWANYLGAIKGFLRELDGSKPPPARGMLSELNGYG
ncbi:hypothetical protein [Rhodococcoides corynebacterioides]|uniref:hypothetical protein n=1 Tax=Rhodococcoides corynebacterioides TaxID=53972 RepID=UPI003ADD4428